MGSFLDKTTGFREAGDGLMVVDWIRCPKVELAKVGQTAIPIGPLKLQAVDKTAEDSEVGSSVGVCCRTSPDSLASP